MRNGKFHKIIRIMSAISEYCMRHVIADGIRSGIDLISVNSYISFKSLTTSRKKRKWLTEDFHTRNICNGGLEPIDEFRMYSTDIWRWNAFPAWIQRIQTHKLLLSFYSSCHETEIKQKKIKSEEATPITRQHNTLDTTSTTITTRVSCLHQETAS